MAANQTVRDSNECVGLLTSTGYNLLEVTDGCMLTGTLSTVVIDTSAHLWPLDDYGGLTLTHHVPPGSPAVDSGACQSAADEPIMTDQRGILRPRGNGCDIGAAEAVWINPVRLPIIRR